MLFGLLFTKKELEEYGKKEYLRGAEITAEHFKAAHINLDAKNAIMNDDFNTLKKVKEEYKLWKAQIVLDGIQEIFNPSKNEEL